MTTLSTVSESLKPAGLQVRISDPKAADRGDSWETQELISRQWAGQHGYHIVKVFYEPYNGDAWDRPIMEDVLSFYAKNPEVKTHIVPRLDRFTRAGSDYYLLFKKRFQDMGVELRDVQGTIQPKVNLLDHTGFQYDWSIVSPSRSGEVFKAEAAREDRVQFLAKTISKEILLAGEGYTIRPAPLGLTTQKIFDEQGKRRTITVPHPGEGPWLRAMYLYRAEGILTREQICDKINAMGFRTRAFVVRDPLTRQVMRQGGGKKLDPDMLDRLLANPRQCNVILEKWTQGKAIFGKGKGNTTLETFNRANQGKIHISLSERGEPLISHNRRPYIWNVNNPTFPYRFVVRCSLCGGNFRGSSSKGRKKHYPGYHCSKNHPYFRVPQKEFHATVEKFVRSLRFTLDAKKAFRAVALQIWERMQGRSGKIIATSKKSIASLQNQQGAVVEQLIQTTSPTTRKLLEAKIESLEKQIQHSTDTMDQEQISQADLTRYLDQIEAIMQEPSKSLIEPTNQPLIQRIWGYVFESFPTYEKLRNGTAELALSFALCSDPNMTKTKMAAQLQEKWNQIIKKVKSPV